MLSRSVQQVTYFGLGIIELQAEFCIDWLCWLLQGLSFILIFYSGSLIQIGEILQAYPFDTQRHISRLIYLHMLKKTFKELSKRLKIQFISKWKLFFTQSDDDDDII